MLHATLLRNETEKHKPSAQRPASPSCRHVCRSSKAQSHAFPYTLSSPRKRCVSGWQAQQPDSTVASGRSRTEPRPSHHLCARRSHARGRGSSSDTVSFVLSPVTAAAKATGLGRGGRAPTGHFSPHGRAQSQALSGVTPPRAGIPGDLGGRAALFARHPLLPASSWLPAGLDPKGSFLNPTAGSEQRRVHLATFRRGSGARLRASRGGVGARPALAGIRPPSFSKEQ